MQKMIIEELGLSGLPQEKQEELLVKIGEIVMKRIYLNTMERLEREVSGISRPKDFRYCIENSDGLWHVSVAHRGRQIEGFLISCSATALNMLGPGVARTQQQAAALIHAELDRHRGRSPLFLVPVACKELVQQLYSWGARNSEIHVAQVHGVAQAPAGVTMPTFLPESG